MLHTDMSSGRWCVLVVSCPPNLCKVTCPALIEWLTPCGRNVLHPPIMNKPPLSDPHLQSSFAVHLVHLHFLARLVGQPVLQLVLRVPSGGNSPSSLQFSLLKGSERVEQMGLFC
ncbi:hypothetical protein E2C01_007385 [Portunus trituberculatus]|uniref:Uncharacterized protein n=1 Tax=Portunus trituberculatus TaxID=210409 RepID=A0A5B7CXS9_PORTR|nr:hypothetical protein [Portunus trituberculatus]